MELPDVDLDSQSSRRPAIFSNIKEVWGYDDYYGEVRTVDVTVTRLRKQIEDNPSEPQYIKNKRGMGYYIE